MAKKLTLFERAFRDMPTEAGVEVDPLRMKTIEDLRYSCLIQLDLIEEGQDSAEGCDPKPIRKWLKKYGKKGD
jgi:hypothetical protein